MSNQKIINFNCSDDICIIQSEKKWYSNNNLIITYDKNKNHFKLSCGCQSFSLNELTTKEFLSELEKLKGLYVVNNKYVIHLIDKKADIKCAELKCESGNYYISISDKPYSKNKYSISKIEYMDATTKYLTFKNNKLYFKNRYDLNSCITLFDITFILNNILNFYLNKNV